MPGASDAAVSRHAASEDRWVLTFDRNYGELVFPRSVPPPPAIVYPRQGAFSAAWPAHGVLDPLSHEDWVAGLLVVVAGRGLQRLRLLA